MSCENNEAKVKWVYGNTRTVVITLEELVDTETGETVPFDIQEGDVVSVNIRGTYSSKSYEPTVDGNTLTFKVGKELAVGGYVIEVGVVRGEDEYVSRKRWQLAVVRYDDEANIPDDAEFSVEDLELIANMYIKGDMFTYDDMTEEQKVDLASRVGADFSIDADGYLCYNDGQPVQTVYVKYLNGNYYYPAKIEGKVMKVYCAFENSDQMLWMLPSDGRIVSPAGHLDANAPTLVQAAINSGYDVTSYEKFIPEYTFNQPLENWQEYIEIN